MFMHVVAGGVCGARHNVCCFLCVALSVVGFPTRGPDTMPQEGRLGQYGISGMVGEKCGQCGTWFWLEDGALRGRDSWGHGITVNPSHASEHDRHGLSCNCNSSTFIRRTHSKHDPVFTTSYLLEVGDIA